MTNLHDHIKQQQERNRESWDNLQKNRTDKPSKKETHDLSNQLTQQTAEAVMGLAVSELEKDLDMIGNEIDRLRNRDEEGDLEKATGLTEAYAIAKHTLSQLQANKDLSEKD